LDEEHEELSSGPKDGNKYLLGRMGRHNVVIAFSSEYGVKAAARTATNMVLTFRNIRFGLLVGVGGGAPNPPDPKEPLNDIRLGDVVVSFPKGRSGKQLSKSGPLWNGRGFPCNSISRSTLIVIKGAFSIMIWAYSKMMGCFKWSPI
jgi:nucleoside phosphorylase